MNSDAEAKPPVHTQNWIPCIMPSKYPVPKEFQYPQRETQWQDPAVKPGCHESTHAHSNGYRYAAQAEPGSPLERAAAGGTPLLYIWLESTPMMA